MVRDPRLNDPNNALGLPSVNRRGLPRTPASPDLKLLQTCEQTPKKKRPRGRPRTNDGDSCCPQVLSHVRTIAFHLQEIRHQLKRTHESIEHIEKLKVREEIER